MNVEFTPPKGFVPPENTEAGKPFDLVCSFVPTPEGKLRLTKLGDVDVEQAAEEPQHKPDYSDYSRGMMEGGSETGEGMGQGGGMQ